MAAKVYFADMRSNEKQSLLDKVGKLYRRAGMGSIVTKNDLVAVKVHFGGRGNTTYIRPQFICRLVDLVRNSGGKPFLTDANTLYVGGGPMRLITWRRPSCTVLITRWLAPR